MPTIDELRILQALPLDMKIRRTQQRIREWVGYYGVDDVYLSFSGGKDSTVLAHIISKMGLPIQKVFADTGLEYPEIRAFVKSFGDVIMVRPKMRFDEVIRKYGYPIIGKEVAERVYNARRCISSGGAMSSTTSNSQDNFPVKAKQLLGIGGFFSKRYDFSKWEPLLDVDFQISHLCCREMKKKPLQGYKNKIYATMTEESFLRQTAWMKVGCNAFDSNHPRSAPMSFSTEQDVLAYIKAYNVPIASVYGEVVYDNKGQKYADTLCDCGGKLCTTGCKRTGCIFCAFGAGVRGDDRFVRLKRTHPRQYEYCMEGGAYDADGLWKPTKQGLGMRHVINEVNKIYGKNFIRY